MSNRCKKLIWQIFSKFYFHFIYQIKNKTLRAKLKFTYQIFSKFDFQFTYQIENKVSKTKQTLIYCFFLI